MLNFHVVSTSRSFHVWKPLVKSTEGYWAFWEGDLSIFRTDQRKYGVPKRANVAGDNVYV